MPSSRLILSFSDFTSSVYGRSLILIDSPALVSPCETKLFGALSLNRLMAPEPSTAEITWQWLLRMKATISPTLMLAILGCVIDASDLEMCERTLNLGQCVAMNSCFTTIMLMRPGILQCSRRQDRNERHVGTYPSFSVNLHHSLA